MEMASQSWENGMKMMGKWHVLSMYCHVLLYDMVFFGKAGHRRLACNASWCGIAIFLLR
jgi:hypothetical protein